jgi:hypothetical protein
MNAAVRMTGVDHLQAARILAASRIALGTALLVAPRTVSRSWLGGAGGDPRTLGLLGRAAGARDLALGAGTLKALTDGEAARPWVVASAACDAVDAVATLAGMSRGRFTRTLLLVGVAAGGAVAGELVS